MYFEKIKVSRNTFYMECSITRLCLIHTRKCPLDVRSGEILGQDYLGQVKVVLFKFPKSQKCCLLQKWVVVRSLGARVMFLWIPSHEGLKGNDRVDHAARSGVLAVILVLGVRLHDQLRHIWQWTKRRWLLEWRRQEMSLVEMLP